MSDTVTGRCRLNDRRTFWSPHLCHHEEHVRRAGEGNCGRVQKTILISQETIACLKADAHSQMMVETAVIASKKETSELKRMVCGSQGPT